MQSEKWADIKGWEGLYQVSNLGRVKSVTRIVSTKKGVQSVNERILVTDVVKGYHRVTMSFKNRTVRKFVHVLVAEAFIPNPDNKPCVNQIIEQVCWNGVQIQKTRGIRMMF